MLEGCIHIRNFARIDLLGQKSVTSTNAFVLEFSVFSYSCTRIGNNFNCFLARIKINDFVGYLTVFNFQIWCFNKAIFIDTRIAS